MKLSKSILPLALLATATLATTAHAQTKPNLDVECEANHDDDLLGKMYCSSLRDAIAKSPRYILGEPPTGGAKKHFWTIRVSTIPAPTLVLRDGSRVKITSALAATLTFDQRVNINGVVGSKSRYVQMWVANLVVAEATANATNQLVVAVDDKIVSTGIEEAMEKYGTDEVK